MSSLPDAKAGEISRLKMVLVSQRSLLDNLTSWIRDECLKDELNRSEIDDLSKRQSKAIKAVNDAEARLRALGVDVTPMRTYTPDEVRYVPPSSKLMDLKVQKKGIEELKEMNYIEMERAYAAGDTLLGDDLKAKIVQADKDIKRLDRAIGKEKEMSSTFPSPVTPRPASRPRASHRFSFERVTGYTDKRYSIKCACSKGYLCTEWTKGAAPRVLVDQYYAAVSPTGGLDVMVPLFGQVLERVRDVKSVFGVDDYNSWSSNIRAWRTLEIGAIPGIPPLMLPLSSNLEHLKMVMDQCESVIESIPAAAESRIRATPADCLLSSHGYGDTDKMQRLIASGDRNGSVYQAMLYLRAMHGICVFCYTRSEPAFMADIAVPSL